MAVRSWRHRQASKETIVREHHHHSQPSTNEDLLLVIAGLEQRVSEADKRHIEQERIVQTIVQAADVILQRLQAAEVRLEQHKGVINDSNDVITALMKAVTDLGKAAEQKLNAA